MNLIRVKLLWIVSGLLLSAVSVAHGQLAIEVGDRDLLPNTSGQEISLYIRNMGASDVLVSGVNLVVQVADSGPSSEGGVGVINGPNITGLDVVTGTVFSTVPNTGPNATLWPNPEASKQFATGNTATTSIPTVSLGAGTETLLATVTFDTTGFTSLGTSWDLFLGNTVRSHSRISGMG